jgi:hypothetical protein
MVESAKKNQEKGAKSKEKEEMPVHPFALKDPCNDRPIKSVPLPPAIPLALD